MMYTATNESIQPMSMYEAPVLSTEYAHVTIKLEAIQRWSAICRMWPWTLTYQKFLLCVSSQSQDLYSHQKLNMYIYWFSSESSYRCLWRRQCRQWHHRMPQYNH